MEKVLTCNQKNYSFLKTHPNFFLLKRFHLQRIYNSKLKSVVKQVCVIIDLSVHATSTCKRKFGGKINKNVSCLFFTGYTYFMYIDK